MSINQLWYVCHPDGEELGLVAPSFGTEKEAKAKCDEWNREVPGHYVEWVGEAPPEFKILD